MVAANAYSLGHRATPAPVVAPGVQAATGDDGNAPADAEIAELTRLIASIDPDKHYRARERLEKQKERKKEVTSKVERRGGCPPQLQVKAQTVEDPLETRRDSHGHAVPLGALRVLDYARNGPVYLQLTRAGCLAVYVGRNVLGEYYAVYTSPLSYTRGKTAAEIFARMKRAIREDIQARDARRIAVLNQQERARKQQLQDMGYLSPDAVIEARFDYLMRRESTDPAS